MVQEADYETLKPITYRLKKYTPTPVMLEGYASEAPANSPSEWFSKKYPAQAEQYGPPMLESVETLLDQSTQVSPVALNPRPRTISAGSRVVSSRRTSKTMPRTTI